MPARARIEPGDIPPNAAAKRMGMTLAEFETVLPRLLSRGFPAADRDTGMFDLDAIDAWRRRRNPHLFPLEVPSLTPGLVTSDAQAIVAERLRGMGRSGAR